MRKIIVVAFAILTVFTLVACKKEVNKEVEVNKAVVMEGEKEKKDLLDIIKENGVLIVATSADYPPNEWHLIVEGKDEIVGYEIEMAKLIAQKIGVKLEIIDMNFDGILPSIITGDSHLGIAGLAVTEERKGAIDFSKMYSTGTQGILIRKDDIKKYVDQKSFKGVNVGVQMASLQEELANKYLEGAKIVQAPKLSNLILELNNKTIDALVSSSDAAGQFAIANPNLVFIDVGFPSDNGSAIGLAKGNEKLKKVVDEVVIDLKSSGKLQELIDEYTQLSQQSLEKPE